MALRVVGAGLGRTGTMSLKLALERLLGAPCYHMVEVFARPRDVEVWHEAIRGGAVDWDAVFDGYAAAVDWPVVAKWREIAEAYPDAVILLSTRSSGEAWWRSADRTIFETFRKPGAIVPDDDPASRAWRAMAEDMLRLFTPSYLDRETAIEAYERHNDTVRAQADPARLLDWSPGDGWGPLCERLGVPVPDEPFPHANTTEEFRARAQLD